MVEFEFDLKSKLFTVVTMAGNDLLTPGTELKELKFDGFLDWFVSVTDVTLHWKYQPTYLISSTLFTLGGIATLFHALKRGGRLPWLWLGICIHGILIECVAFVHPDVDNYWHSQTPIMFVGRRLPLHIMFLYPCFLYNSAVAAAKMRLPSWSEPFAAALGEVLIDLPYDIVSVKFIHWFWHDTDPNIYDRHYWVPWNSYYFHAAFGASFVFWFHFLKKKICPSEGKWISSKSFTKELFTTILAGVLGPIGGILLFIPIYHPLHDKYKIHSEVTFFILFTVFLLLVWSGDRMPKLDDFSKKCSYKIHWTTLILCLYLIIHYVVFLLLPIFFNPEQEVSTGIKETLGPCDNYVGIRTVYGEVLQKRKYLCPTDYDEKYFDWHCLPGNRPPPDGTKWYTACGTPFENRAEYIAITTLLLFLGLVVYYNAHFKSFGDEVFSYKDVKKINKETKKSKSKKNV